MVQIVPAIIPKTFEEIEDKIKKIEPYVEWAQLDIMDNIFVPNATFNNPVELKELKTPVKIDAHLMIAHPEKALPHWLPVIDRVTIHWEALFDIRDIQFKMAKIIDVVHSAKKELGIAINPETDWNVLEPFLSRLDLVLFLSVNPGFGGQDFIPSVLDKIKFLREKYPNVKIGVDGGIKSGIARQVAEAGVNLIVAGTAIFEAADIKEAIENLKKETDL